MSTMVAILKIYFSLLLLNQRLIDFKPGRKHRVTCRSKIAKIVQDDLHGGHHENLFFASSPEVKGQFNRNLVGSIGVTGRSKVGQIVSIGNPRWHSGHLENLFFASSPEPKGQLTRTGVGSFGVT